MKNVVLHIGPHKTASTSLQVALRSNRDELQKAGVLYPVTGTGKETARIHGHHNLAWLALGNYRYKRRLGDWDDLKKEIETSNCQHIFVSSEAFSQLGTNAIADIKRTLSAYSVRILYVARRYDDTIRSAFAMSAVKFNVLSARAYYRSFVATRLSSPFDQLRERNSSSEPAVRTFLHRPKLQGWLEAFGKDALKIVFFDNLFPDYFEQIAEASEFPGSLPKIELPRVNPARSLAHIGVITAMSRALKGKMSPAEFNLELAPLVATTFADFSEGLPRPAGLPKEVLDMYADDAEADMVWLEQHAPVPPGWRTNNEGKNFVEIRIPSTNVGRLIAGDFVVRRIDALQKAIDQAPTDEARNAIAKRQERLDQVRQALMSGRPD